MPKFLDASTTLCIEYIYLAVETPTDDKLVIISSECTLLDLVSDRFLRDRESSHERVFRKGIKVEVIG